MSGWIVVSFYTSGTGYEQEAKKLEASLVKFGLPYKIYVYPPLGTWRKNLTYKSECILRAFDEFPDTDIVFIDADGIVRKHPALFDLLSAKHDHDMACHFFRYSFSTEELLSGTLWFQNGVGGRALVKRWDEIGRAKPAIRHQACLKLATGEPLLGRPVKIYHLPIEYTCIFDAPARRGKQAVIEHYQASRRLRYLVGYGEGLVPARTGRRFVLASRIKNRVVLNQSLRTVGLKVGR